MPPPRWRPPPLAMRSRSQPRALLALSEQEPDAAAGAKLYAAQRRRDHRRPLAA
ncbi:MAG: hypothetical protein R3F11_28875 [Verrucomicrobiales bacterium]